MCEATSINLSTLLLTGANLTEAQIDRANGRNGLFESAFLINLDSEPGRLHDAWLTFDKVDIYAERFKAFDGDKLRKGNILSSEQLQRFTNLSSGQLGCLFSHLCVLYIASIHPNQNLYTLVFEDDIITSIGKDGFNNLLENLRRVDQEESVHLIYFGKCMESCTQMTKVFDNIYRAISPRCTHAYAIKNSFAKQLVKDFESCCNYPNSVTNCSFFERPIDRIYANYITHGIARGLVIHPGIFYQDVLNKPSTVNNGNLLAYQECGDLSSFATPVSQASQVQTGRKLSLYTLIASIVLFFIILIVIYILKKRGKMQGKTRLIIVALIGVGIWVVYSYLRNRNTSRGLEKLTLKTVVEYSRKGSRRFPVNLSVIPSQKHDFFNPNGINWKDSTGHDIFITSTRSFDGISSYPLLQVLDPHIEGLDNFHLIYSKMLWLQSHRSMKSNSSLGYEDMRIFSWMNEIYLIGVNLDRSENGTPSMVLVLLDTAYNHIKTWHLVYPPISKFPNKNWAPIVLNDGELGFVVDLDPLLIVKRIHLDNEYQETCELVFKSETRILKPKIRNSTITIAWSDVPATFKPAFLKIAPYNAGFKRYIMMGHTKYINIGLVKMDILYQHYFAVIDLSYNEDSTSVVNYSGPLHVEENYSPHIEYISGISFIRGVEGDENSWMFIVMYGLRDNESGYILLRPDELEKLLEENPLSAAPDIPEN